MDSSSVLKGLVYGGIASMVADIVTLPVDVTKTRLQLTGEGGLTSVYSGAVDCAVKTARAEGPTALWKGLEPALWRQASYGSMRYGFYSPIKDALAPGVPKSQLPLWKKVLAGAIAGAVSSAVANPADLVKVRMQASGMATADGAAAISRGYRWFWPTFVHIARSEGIGGLYKGTGPTSARATALAAAELASYDHIKQHIRKKGLMPEGLGLHIVTAVCAGFAGALACNPFDVVKSRIMNQPVDSAGKGLRYGGMLDCMSATVKKEGLLSLWNGFIPAWARVGPRVVVVFVVMEQLKLYFEPRSTQKQP